ncbi:hypothetical protein KVT40_007971 [Elsinoe batatas]|uniref:Urease accessory protein UreF n=1 Tax=Elsinoe batatas TaxID=2601811 RepID=A0A8K0P944_9PEZI|nr:hypothetical protein KVT40_007971 [Elsinoe batatas]
MNPHHPTLHPLLLLSDSALPLGSFAFSSGLESYLAHTKYFSAHLVTDFSSNGPTHSPSRPVSRGPPKGPTAHQLMQFLKQSVHNSASTLIPFLLGGWHRPEMLLELDDALDAATPCTVARRASTAQGKALGVVWSRALRSGCEIPFSDDDYSSGQDREGGTGQTRDGGVDALMEIVPQGHLPPLFGAVSRAMGLGEADAAYVFLLNHVKAVLSAMVRAGVMGPYQSQGVLAGREVGKWISEAIADDVWALVESAGVSIPAMDLWMGRHELLYSRIFNS